MPAGSHWPHAFTALVAGGFGLPLVSRLVVFPVLAEEVGLGRIVKVTTLGPNVVMADVRALLSFERDGDRLRLGTIGFLGSAPSAGQPVYLATGETESALASAAGNTWHRATGEDQRQDEA